MLSLHKIINGVWMIEESFAANYLPYITDFLQNPVRINPDRKAEQFLRIHNGSDSRKMIMDIDNAPEGSIAVISISGAITKHDQECGPDGMQSKASVLRACYSTGNIKGVILKIDSGGGEGSAMRLFIEAVSEKNKPVVAFIDDRGCSAAYGIASGCDHIVANSNMAEIGSIGTYLTIADYEKYYEQRGIKLIDIYATASTDKNKDYYEALKGNLAPLRKVADKFNESFLSTIEKNREGKLTAGRDTWGTGKVWFAEDALKLGLIDEINTFSNTLNFFCMTKILKDSTYDELKAKADRLDAIVAKLRESAVGFDLDELTGESIIDFIETGSKIDEALEADTQAELETAKTRITELEKELERANARVAELEKELDETPAEEPAAITAKGETGGEEQDILKFAKKNENNPFTVLDKMKEQGFI